MRNGISAGMAALAFFVACAPVVLADNTGDVTVHVIGMKNSNGIARVALFNSQDAYAAKMDPTKAFRREKVPIANQEATVTFKDVPYGDYAVKYYHDEDNSGNFKTNMFGIPKVEYGFSNNANASHGAPPYDKAKFTLNAPQMNLEVKTQHAAL